MFVVVAQYISLSFTLLFYLKVKRVLTYYGKN